jgi:hypothetical protein
LAVCTFYGLINAVNVAHQMATKKHPGGRPTDYGAEMLARVDEYLNGRKDDIKVVGKGKRALRR